MEDTLINQLLVFIVPLSLLAVFWVIIQSLSTKRAYLNKLSAYMAGSIGKSFFMPSFSGEHQGYKFSVDLVSGGKNSPDYLQISLFKKSAVRLNIYKESPLTEIGKKIGVVREVKIIDPNFDKEFFVLSNEPDQLSGYINNNEIKTAIRDIFNKGFNSIVMDGKKLSINKPNYNPREDTQATNITHLLQKLSLLIAGL